MVINRIASTVFTLLFILASFTVCAQEDTSSTKGEQRDSLHNVELEANTLYLEKLDSIKQADSIKRLQLEEELKTLKTTDNLKKEELLAELQKIKEAEQQRVDQKKKQVDSLKKYVKGFPVSPFEDTICYIYARIGPFAPQTRAQNIEKSISKMEDDILYNKDSMRIYVSDEVADLLYNDNIILSITDKDALWMDMSKEALAQKYKEKIAESITAHRNATSLTTLLKEIGLAILVIIVLTILIKLMNRGYRLLRLKVLEAKGGAINGIKIRSYELFTAESEVRAIHLTLNVLRWLIILILIYLSLPVLFSIFPWTKTLSGTLIGYVLTPLKSIAGGVWNYLPDLFTVIVIIFVFRYVFRGLKFLRDEVKTGALNIPGFYPDWATPTYQIIRVFLFAFMIVVVFPYLPNSDSDIFKGVSVFLGVIVTFGSSGALSNLIAGLVLTYMRAFKIGDRVKIGEVSGDIIEKTLLVTRIRTIKNEDITIPNSTIMNSHTINYSSAAQNIGLIVHSTVTIGYDVPWKQVHELLINAALASDFIQEEPVPFVLQTSLDDYYVSYQINAYTKEPAKQAIIYSSLHQNIQDKFNEAGVEIMSPHYRAMRDGNQTTVPTDYLPEDYIAPSFRVKNDEDNKNQQ
ncbi:MAG: mechanosensitive ion channel [Chitinophagales bacterium]|nr:mechanosensitive ion channel [Chitinophagaceae bacterium]MCB9064223.1 mechanosensitive ion channel [Chitinophagales bacterium]